MPTTTMSIPLNGKRPVLGRALGTAALAGLVLVTVIAMTDRVGASVMPSGPLSAGKARGVFAAANSAGDSDTSLAAGERMVRWAPVVRGSLSAYGVALGTAGYPDRAAEVLRAASSLGWRDEVAQAYASTQALVNGEVDLAAFRMEALLRSAPESQLTRQTLAQIMLDDGARLALARRMGEGVEWPANVLIGLRDRPAEEIAATAVLLAEARQFGFRADDRVARWETFAIYEENPRLAWALWLALNGEGGLARSGLWDDTFAVADKVGSGTSAPFEWRRATSTSANVNVGEVDGKPRVEVIGGGFSAQDISRQAIVLEPGRYVMSWSASSRIEGRPDLHLSAVCVTPNGSMTLGPIVPTEGKFGRLLEVGADCEVVQARIFAPSGDTTMRWLSDVQIASVD